MAIKYTQVVDLANQRITSLGSPSAGTDAANKQYVDNVALGMNWKQAVRAAATGNVNLATPGSTFDGVTVSSGDRLLLLNQADGKENGIYTFDTASTALVRASDADTNAEIANATVSIAEGAVYGDTTYILVTNAPITLGTTSLVFGLMNGGSGTSYTPGNGVSLAGDTVNLVTAAGGGVSVGPGGIAVDTAVVVRKFAMNIGDGAATTIPVAHGLNTLDVVVEVYVNSGSRETVITEVQRTDANTVSLVFGTAPAAAAYRVVVHG